MSNQIGQESKIAVIAGGISAEREISLRSGKNVFDALQRLGYKNSFLFDFDDASNSIKKLVDLKENCQMDLAFLVTHGKYGEDGCLQAVLEFLKVPYTGSKVLASAACMDKIATKKTLSYYGLPVLPFWYEEVPGILEEQLEDMEEGNSPATKELLGFMDGSFIVKPRDEGSSVGVVKMDDFEEFEDDESFAKVYSNCIVEPFVEGLELTASILEVPELVNAGKNVLMDDGLLSLPLLELRSKNEFYDFEAKYTPGKTEFVLPAEIPEELAAQIHLLAMDAFDAMECSGYARVDFIIEKKDNAFGQAYILELNTLPGMTELSDMPAQAKAAGIEYDQLVELILHSCVPQEKDPSPELAKV